MKHQYLIMKSFSKIKVNETVVLVFDDIDFKATITRIE